MPNVAGPNDIVKIFDFNDSMVRVVEKDGELWWVAKDICQVLDLENVSKASAALDEDEVTTSKVIDSIGRTQEVLIVNEPGLYSLIMRSRKPEAKAFKRWVMHEVLPTIRKTGQYRPAPDRGFDWIEREMQGAIRLASLFGLTGNQGLLAANRAFRNYYNQEPVALLGTQLEAPTPDQLLTPTDLGAQFDPKLSGAKVNKLLEATGLQRSLRNAKGDQVWEPTQAGLEFAVVLDTGRAHSDGSPVRQTKWRSSVMSRISVPA